MRSRATAKALAALATFALAATGATATATGGAQAPGSGTNGTLFPYASFWDVPQLGREPVLGTGCGGDGRLGDQIPDGIWSGYVLTTDGTAAIDLVCVIADGRGSGFVVEGEDNIINADPLVVDNNTRVRYAPAPSTRYAMGEPRADGSCAPRPAVPGDHIPYGAIAWFGVSGGNVSWVFYNCTGFAPPMPELPPPAAPAPPAAAAEETPELDGAPALPAAYADPGSTATSWWPFPSFTEVPQFGNEPVRGTGCGGSGNLGDTVPDGLWTAFATYDVGNDRYELDLVCVYYGTIDEVADDATVLDQTPGWVVVNNNTRRRIAGNDTRIVVFGAAADGVCRPDQAFVAQAGRHGGQGLWSLVDPARVSWVRIADGNVTGVFRPC